MFSAEVSFPATAKVVAQDPTDRWDDEWAELITTQVRPNAPVFCHRFIKRIHLFPLIAQIHSIRLDGFHLMNKNILKSDHSLVLNCITTIIIVISPCARWKFDVYSRGFIAIANCALLLMLLRTHTAERHRLSVSLVQMRFIYLYSNQWARTNSISVKKTKSTSIQ